MDSTQKKNRNTLRELGQRAPGVLWRRALPYLALFVVVLGGVWLVYHNAASDSSAKSSGDKLTAVTSAVGQAEDREEHPIQWLENYDEAISQAKKRDLPVFIDFAASWCTPCVMMDKHVWPKAAVRQALDSQVIPMRVDLDAKSTAPLVEKYNIEFVPTILLIDAQGQELKREGFVDDEQLLEMIKSTR